MPLLGTLLLALTLATPGIATAAEFDASVAPDGRFLLKLYPRVFYASAWFDDRGKARNLTDVTGLFYAELPLHLQYGVTGALSVGIRLPLGWTYQESGPQGTTQSNLAVREVWLTVQHRWLPLVFISSASLRVKIPLATKALYEDGLRIGDGQVDLWPVYYLDYFSRTHFWFIETSLGYRYRFASGDVKPFDELGTRAHLGYEFIPDYQMRFFLIAELTQFLNGHFPGDEVVFHHNDGSIHAFGYGMSLWPRPTMRLEISTMGDWSGRNQFRGMQWTVGITKIL